MNTPPHPITVTFENGTTLSVARRTPLRDVLPAAGDSHGLPYIAALVNNDVTSLSYLLEMDCSLRPLTRLDPEGAHVYQRSLTFLVAKAVKELYPAAAFSVDYTMGNAIYCSFDPVNGNGHGSGALSGDVEALLTRLRALIAADIPIERHKVSFADAIARFSEAGQTDKLNLLKFRNPPRITIHGCGGFYDLAQGPLAPSTGVLTCFELTHYPPGFLLRLPLPGEPECVAPFQDQPHLFQIFREHKAWGRILGVNTVGRLNEIIVNGNIGDFIKISEALHEKKVATIADEITRRRADVRVVLVAGPSSAGKTTFSKRLGIQLRVNGLHVSTISLDNYFLGLDQTPRRPDGQPDFEHIESLDLPLFNRHLQAIIAGEAVELPVFDFETKQRAFKGEHIRLGPDSVLIIEGIHGLNPGLTEQVPERNKFRVYVSALTQLSVDFNNRISTTDNRLIRRMVRDHKYRGHSALRTLGMWSSVRRGEERWIFPFQSHADATFNSALDYELAVLKPIAEPLLMEVKPFNREYAEARRLTAFLLNFIGIPDREVPSTSMLREYIGRSGFRY
jgi:uridine kinase